MECRGPGEGHAALRGADAGVWVFAGGCAAAGGGGGVVSEVDAPKPRPARMVSFWRVISLLLLVAVFYFVGKQLGKDFKELKAQQVRVQVNWIFVGAGCICLMGARITNAVNTWLLLRALGVDLPMWRVVAVIWVSSLGRYIPGKAA